MKKLLITTMAAVSVGLCAKADLTAETFETYGEGSLFGTLPGDSSKYDISDGWHTETTLENLFTVTNIANYVGADTYPEEADRPSKSNSLKALAIDTSAPLLRYADSTEEPQSLSDAPIFFDSVVQFTATDVAPSMENNTTDKLAVWLYTSPDDVSDTNPGLFGETSPITKVAVTAGYLDGATLKTKNYITDIGVEPDTWHRLTIKSFKNDIDDLLFNIWVDGTQVSGKETFEGQTTMTDFLSRISDAVNSDTYNKLQAVAFDGKGAVDDIVFTTTDPFYVEVADAKLNITFNDFSAINVKNGAWYQVNDDDVNLITINDALTEATLKAGDKVSVWFSLLEGYELVSPVVEPDEEGFYVITVDALTADGATIAIVTRKAEGGEEPEEPAKPTIGGNAVDTAEAFIAAANSGVAIKVPTDWTLDGNTLKYADDVEYATFADYYTVTLATDGTVTLELNDTAKPTIDETATDADDAIVLTDTTVSLGVTNAKAGLWYGAQAYSDAACTTKVGGVIGWEKATGETVTVTATKPEGDKAFFKVVVDDQDHTPAEEPK